MKYTMKERVSYSRVDEKERLTFSGLMDYFQDCVYFQGEDLQLGAKRVQATKRGWVVSNWEVEVKRYPLVGEWVTIETFATGFRDFKGNRCVQMLDADGNRIALATSLWVFMDFNRKRPTRPIEEEYLPYGQENEIPLEHPGTGKRIAMPETFESLDPVTISRSQIDSNGHVNNCQYIRIATDLLPRPLTIRHMRIEYHKSAILGDTLLPKLHMDVETAIVRLCGAEDKDYTVVEFIGE